MGNFVSAERHGAVAVLRMQNERALNAIGSHDDCRDLVDALEALAADRNVSVGILTGAGRAFCAGGNLRAIQRRTGIGPLEQPDSTRTNYRRGVQRVVRTLYEIEVPMIAAVNGHAVGLGCDLACLCDIRIAAESAKFSASFIKVGIVPGDGGAWLLQQAVGHSTTAEMLLTGDRYSAGQAERMGLVSRVVPDDRLMEEAMALAGSHRRQPGPGAAIDQAPPARGSAAAAGRRARAFRRLSGHRPRDRRPSRSRGGADRTAANLPTPATSGIRHAAAASRCRS